jgi:hypothetical protein
MNDITSMGGRKKEREIAESAVKWCISKMMPRMKTLDINISFEKIPAYGYCMEEDSNRQFTLTIQKGLSLYDLISTVCHEMVHVKQYARKELRNVNGNTMWKKKSYNSVDYWDAPWEKEAFRLEESLALECFKEMQISA